MRTSRNNVLLTEILIAVLFFALCGTTIIKVFASSEIISRKAENTDSAVRIATDTAELLYAGCIDPAALGITETDGSCTFETDGFTVSFSVTEESMPAGALRSADINVYKDDELITSLPCSRYIPGEVSQ